MEAKNTSIHNAALNGDLPAVEKLLHEDPKLATAVDGDLRTPLHWACVSGSSEIFRILLNLPSDGRVEDQQSLAKLDTEDGFGNYHVKINQQDEGGWVSRSPLSLSEQFSLF